MQINVNAAAICALVLAFASPVAAGDFAPGLSLSSAGSPIIAFSAQQDGCNSSDVPDAPLRAFRSASGQTVAFGLHFENRRLIGPSIDRLKINCKVVLGSGHNAAPGAYNDYNWITATWTDDGRTIAALVHHEFHANEHPGKCVFRTMMQCWMNTITAWKSVNSGASFRPGKRGFVVAAAPFRQSVDQGRHRGFFNPSNIFSDGRFKYFMASNTGWNGQPFGVCLFRSANPHKPENWRAWDGEGFTIRYSDPYTSRNIRWPKACKPIVPFPAPVGSIVRHRPSGQWLAVFQAAADKRYFPMPGIYYATARNLTRWSAPRLLIAGNTLYDDPCKSGGRIISYPSLIGANSKGRNYDNTGSRAFLFYASMKVNGCSITSERNLIRFPVRISSGP